MIRLFLGLVLLIASQGLTWSDDRPIAFDPDVYYDIYFSGQGNNSFVVRRVKISDTGSLGGESYLIVKSDRALKDAAGRGYIFMKGIVSIVPSDYFRVESTSIN